MNVIEVSNLVKRYGDRTAVDGVSFSVEEGEIFAILWSADRDGDPHPHRRRPPGRPRRPPRDVLW